MVAILLLIVVLGVVLSYWLLSLEVNPHFLGGKDYNLLPFLTFTALTTYPYGLDGYIVLRGTKC